jgi:hypothetical protein
MPRRAPSFRRKSSPARLGQVLSDPPPISLLVSYLATALAAPIRATRDLTSPLYAPPRSCHRATTRTCSDPQPPTHRTPPSTSPTDFDQFDHPSSSRSHPSLCATVCPTHQHVGPQRGGEGVLGATGVVQPDSGRRGAGTEGAQFPNEEQGGSPNAGSERGCYTSRVGARSSS